MKPFNRPKIIHGIEYMYEITPYYDPKTKKVRQKSRYIGKNQDGTIKKVREYKLKDVFSYGEFLPVQKIITQYKIDKFLTHELGKRQAETVIALCMGRLLRGLSLKNIGEWYEGTWLYYQTRELPLSSASISRLLSSLGESRIQDKLSSHMIRQLKSKRTILYDITSVSSYSELIRLLEWGYNRDHLDLPQINLSVIMDKIEGIPLGYEIYPGSINDVVTLQNTLKKLQVQGVKDFTMVLDRGFYSINNLELLMEKNTDFIIAVPDKGQSAKKLINSMSKEIEKPKYLKKFNDEIMFVKQAEIKSGEHKLKGYCYYNPARAQQEKDSFYKRLYSIKDQIERLKVSKDTKAKAREIMSNLSSYFSLNVSNDQVIVQIKEKAVTRRLNTKGIFIIAYNGENSWDTCLSVYKEKELIEKSFDILKNDLEFSTPQVHKDTTLKGLMFISLIALIIRMKIMNVLKVNDLIKTYSFESMMIQLEKLKVIILENGQTMYSEMTKKQREILTVFDAVPKS
jgi:transposase